MFSQKRFESSNNLADGAAHSADGAIRSTQRLANEALDGLAGSVQDLSHQAGPMLNRANEQAIALARRGVDAVRDSSQHLRDTALRASDSTANAIKGDPFKAVLIAAVTGAALMALVGLMTRSRGRG